MDRDEHQSMIQAKQERDRIKKRLCGVVTSADMDPFIRQGMTRVEAHRAALKMKLRRSK